MLQQIQGQGQRQRITVSVQSENPTVSFQSTANQNSVVGVSDWIKLLDLVMNKKKECTDHIREKKKKAAITQKEYFAISNILPLTTPFNWRLSS